MFGLWQEMLGRGEDPRGCAFEICDAAGIVLTKVLFDQTIGLSPDGRRPVTDVVLRARENAASARRLASELSRQIEQARGNLGQTRAIVAGLDDVTVARRASGGS